MSGDHIDLFNGSRMTERTSWIRINWGTYGLLALFANWYGPSHIHSDADINEVFLPMFVVQVASVAAGAALGFRWARRQRGQAKGKA